MTVASLCGNIFNMMAATTSFSNEDLLCSQCSDIYCFPVLLKCGHNICRVCLKKFWELKGCQECPVCGNVSLTGRPPINLALKIAADKYRTQRTDGNREICFLHNEKLQIFCQNDEEPICFLCKKSKKHKVHECCPVEEAAQQKKREISQFLESLRKKLRMLKKTKKHREETKSHIQTQAYENESLIREEFEKLHLFLREEENTRLKALKQEEKIKTQVMCEKIDSIKNQIENLSSTITDIETSLKAKDLSFLQGYKQTKKRLKCNIQDPECIRDILINSAKHLGLLKFGIWKKMVDIVKYVPVTMDPNTAQSNLKFSEELTSVQYSTKQLLPDNPERCTNRVCLLGETGFTTGKHRWTVEVGKAKGWYIGVAQESVNRKSAVFLNPAEGFWVIGLCNGDSLWAQTSPPTKLLLKTKPEKITVELDCDRGKVAFMNAADSTKIHTFKDKFREKIFPYFSPGICEEGEISSPLLISPLTIRVEVE